MTFDFFERFAGFVRERPGEVLMQDLTEHGRIPFTFRRTSDEIGKIGVYLRASGIGPGDAVAILMENQPRWGIAFTAVQSAGAIAVPLDILHQTETLAKLIGHAGCRFLITTDTFYPRLREIQALLPAPLPVLAAGAAVEGAAHWDSVLAEVEAPASLPLAARGPDEPLAILYTSGTTGEPKGVVLTERNVFGNTKAVADLVGVYPTDHFLCVLPLYHVLALMTNFLISLWTGARVTFLHALDAPAILKAFREEGITLFVCIPQFYYLLHRRIMQEVDKQPWIKRLIFRRLMAVSRFANRRLHRNPGKLFFGSIHEKFGPRLRLLGVGGARFDPEVARQLRDLGFGIVQAFGMTETAALITVALNVGDEVGTAGRPLPPGRIRIDSPEPGVPGEVLASGPNVMQGYWRNPGATADAIRDGWLHTGDVGYIDASGCLNITGRQKDVIVLSSGKNIYPEEIEHAYQSQCPYIKQMCVMGVPDPAGETGDEKLHAVIVPDWDYLKSKQVVNAYDMIRWTMESISQKLPPYKRVRSFEIRTEPLPLTTTRKIKRHEVQAQLAGGGEARTPARSWEASEPATPAEARLFDLIRRFKKAPAVNREMNLELDLGFDSLERVEFLVNLEEAFGVRFSEEETSGFFTVAHLADALEAHLAGEAAAEARLSWSEILAAPLPPEKAREVEEILSPKPGWELAFYLVARMVRLLSLVLFRMRVRGLENLPRQYPFLICPNHESFLDTFLLSASLPFRVTRRWFFLAHVDYFSNPVTAYLGRHIKVIPVNPDKQPQLSLRLCAEGLRRGLILCIFPEGERSIDGGLKLFRKGPAILACETGTPVVPVGINGTYECWRRGSSRIRLHPVSYVYGPPLLPDPGSKSYDAFTDRLVSAVSALIGEKPV